MSLRPDAAAARKAALEQLKFKKVQKQQNVSLSHTASPAPASWATNTDNAAGGPPAQSRDATATSRYFSLTPSSSGTILVPSSSPKRPDLSDASKPVPNALSLFDDEIPGLTRSDPQVRSIPSPTDPLSAPSGFRHANGVSNASFTRPSSAMNRKLSDMEDMEDGGRPRKRLNMGPTNSRDPIDFLTPGTPEVRKPEQRHAGPNTSLSSISLSSDDSFPDAKDIVNGASRPRIIRGQRAPEEKPSSTSTQANDDEQRFTRFRLTQIEHDTEVVRAAWLEAGGDVPKASALLVEPSWKPRTKTPPPPPPKAPEAAVETGRVKEIVDANKAQRLAVKEKGKKSMIYKNRVIDGKPTSDAGPSTPPASKPPPMIIDSPSSPEIGRRKRLRRKVIASDSEAEFVDSDEDSGDDDKTNADEQRALEYYNESSPEGLQELTGCSPEQAKKIIELRPFTSVEDLNTKLGQGKKKAGPAGISPRMFEDSATIFQGYGKVDSILEECEGIGAELRKEIAGWNHHSTANGQSKGKEREDASRDSSVSAEDGALALTHIAAMNHKPKYYMTVQPSLLQSGVTLKEYQMIGVNWLSLLYQKRYSCILADEMGLGKTVQVISFFAHLKERGRDGPHLVVVPSSTLENWCREFQKFAGVNINVETYYADKNDRPRLRDMLNNNVVTKKAGGWNVLITTYNLAQGDDHDRKFFRRIEWDTCVFDEGHVLKNFQSQRYQALLRYKSRWRLLLTGTPLQNNLQELVSLMNFILPNQFADDLDSLRAVFKTKGDSKVTLLAQQRVSRAKKMMTPFVLRRRKDQVLRDLPKKTERIEWCEMTALQKSIYNDALQRSRKTIFDLETGSAETSDAPATNGRGKPAKKKTRATARTKDKMYIENSSNVLMDLRKAASHPMLFRRRFTDETLSAIAKLLLKEPDFKKRGAVFQYVKEDMEVMTDAELQVFCETYKSLRRYLQDRDCYMQAGKVKVLLDLLERYKEEGRRILIFSQFTQILDILQKVLDLKRTKYLVLTGSTPVDVRQTLVDEFTEDESIPVFLLSTKAGGMGINLTAASVVVMFDQDFNPHNDKQAQDRAYRIGQKRDVDVVKLITKGSIEEDMFALGQMKLALDEAVAGEEAEERVEREMKMSLMNAVRKKLVTDEDIEMKDATEVGAKD